jgi:hypothetical protein
MDVSAVERWMEERVVAGSVLRDPRDEWREGWWADEMVDVEPVRVRSSGAADWDWRGGATRLLASELIDSVLAPSGGRAGSTATSEEGFVGGSGAGGVGRGAEAACVGDELATTSWPRGAMGSTGLSFGGGGGGGVESSVFLPSSVLLASCPLADEGSWGWTTAAGAEGALSAVVELSGRDEASVPLAVSSSETSSMGGSGSSVAMSYGKKK